MPFDIEHAELLHIVSLRAAAALRSTQGAVLEGVRSQAPVAIMRLLERSLREAAAAAGTAAAAYHLYLLDNSELALGIAQALTAGRL